MRALSVESRRLPRSAGSSAVTAPAPRRGDTSPGLVPAMLAVWVTGGFLVLATDYAPIRLAILGVLVVLLGFLSVPALKQLLLGIAILEIPIQVDVYLNHDPGIADGGALSGFNLSITTVVLLVLYGLWVAEAAGNTAPPRRSGISRSAVPTAVYCGIVALSLGVAADAGLAWFEIVVLAQAVLLFAYAVHHVRTREDLDFVVDVLMVGLLLQALIVIGLRIGGEDVIVGPVKADIDGGRVNGTFGSPNVLGSYLTLLLPLALGRMLGVGRRGVRRLAGAAFVLGSVALVLSFSRGAWVGYAVSVAVVLVVARRRGWLAGALPLVMVATTLVLVGLFRNEIGSRLAEYNNLAAQSRLPLMELAFSMIRDSPLTGVGINNFAASLPSYVTIDYSQAWINTVHNKYLLVWAETGILGLGAFLWVLLSALRTGWRQVVAGDARIAPIAVGLTAGILGNMVHMTVEIYHGRPQLHMLWLILGLIAVLPVLGSAATPAGTVIPESVTSRDTR